MLCMWMLLVVLSPNILLWGTSVQAQLLKLHIYMPYIYIIAVIQCQVSDIFCVWFFHLPLRLCNKVSPDFCCKHNTGRNLWAVLLLTWVCSGTFQDTLRNTRHWIKYISHSVSAWNHYHCCTGPGRHEVGSRDGLSWPRSVAAWHWVFSFIKTFPQKESVRLDTCLPVDECSLFLAVCIRPSWSVSCENTDYNWWKETAQSHSLHIAGVQQHLL